MLIVMFKLQLEFSTPRIFKASEFLVPQFMLIVWQQFMGVQQLT